MILEIFERPNYHDRTTPIKTARVQCDVCGKEFIRDLRKFDCSKRHHCSVPCRQTGIRPTPAQRQSIREKLSGIKRSEETKQKMSRNNAMHRIENRNKVSVSRSLGIAEGRICSIYKGRRGTYTSLKTLKDEKYDSLLELLRMKMLDSDVSVVSWTKKHGIRISYLFDDMTKSYVPDFLIVRRGSISLEEIKGWEGEPKTPFKLAALREYCVDHGYEFSYINSKQLKVTALELGII